MKINPNLEEAAEIISPFKNDTARQKYSSLK